MSTRMVARLFYTSAIGLFAAGWAAAGELAGIAEAGAAFARPDRALVLQAGLERAQVYWPSARGAARGSGVPERLLFGVAMCESAFNPYARSRRGAEGMFQFMPATGRLYGLRGRRDRMHVGRSARASARHLADLHRRLGSWELALAAYNAGEGRVRRAVRRAGSTRWQRVRPWLPRETRSYVPRVIYVAERVYPKMAQKGDPAPAVRLVKVQRGDSWWRLERRLRVPSGLLRKLNAGRLIAGGWLAVPSVRVPVCAGEGLENAEELVWRTCIHLRNGFAKVVTK